MNRWSAAVALTTLLVGNLAAQPARKVAGWHADYAAARAAARQSGKPIFLVFR